MRMFFPSTHGYHRLILLQLEKPGSHSQRLLGNAVGLSATAVNSHIRALRHRHWIDVRGSTNRSIVYEITDVGRAYLKRLDAAHQKALDELGIGAAR